jgi:glutamyl-Q tRNA(Asp) synthetase
MAAPESAPYTGRFAPSPTGPLHFGSLLAAIASYLQAKANHGKWLLRIEDIDPPREQAGADQLIISALEQYGFEWDGAIVYQSNCGARHQEAAQSLVERGLAYRCSCSRRDLAGEASGPLGPIYPGTCRSGCDGTETALRVLTDDKAIEFQDGLQGHIGQSLESESGDFVIWRRDGLVAYHLALVVDDSDQGVTEVVRGIDLLDSTPRQIHLQRLLDLPTPGYLHIPVAINQDGQKLSKLTGAPAIPSDDPRSLLVQALFVLQQNPPAELIDSGLQEIWRWAIDHWRVQDLTGLKSIQAGKDSMLQRDNPLR